MEDLIINDDEKVKLSTPELQTIVLGLAELPAKHSFHLIMRLDKIIMKRKQFAQNTEKA